MARAKVPNNPWLHGRAALLSRGVIGVVLAYAFIARALDTGSYWQYSSGIIFAVLGTSLLVRSRKKSR